MTTPTTARQDETVTASDPPLTALEEAVARVGDRWTLLVVNALLDGPRRFNELLDGLAGLAPNVLSKRLRQLETSGLVVVTPYSQRPPRFDYRLSATGGAGECVATPRALGRRRRSRRGPDSSRCVRYTGRSSLVLPDLCTPRRERRNRRHPLRLTR
jgi:DNA-binding HxlR family transcriptional regulator